MIKRQRQNEKAMFCSNCGKKVPLPPAILTTPTRAVASAALDREQLTAVRRTRFEMAITAVKAYLRDTASRAARPTCFISYAWGEAGHERWVTNLARDLRNADLNVIFDRSQNKPGASLTRFIELIASVDFALMIGTPLLREKYDATDADPVVVAELKLINTRLRKRAAESERVIPLLLEGEPPTSFPPLAEDSIFVDFREEDRYFERLFDLILILHGIRSDEPAMDEPREMLRVPDRGRRAARRA